MWYFRVKYLKNTWYIFGVETRQNVKFQTGKTRYKTLFKYLICGDKDSTIQGRAVVINKYYVDVKVVVFVIIFINAHMGKIFNTKRMLNSTSFL